MAVYLIKKRARWIFEGCIQAEGSPKKIALGFALGIMIGMTPFWGLHIPTSLILAAMLRWSKIAAAVGMNITNVGTAPLIYPVNYWIGVKLVGVSRQVSWPRSFDFHECIRLLGESPLIFVDLFIGGLILGMPIAVMGYVAVLKIIGTYRKRALAESGLSENGSIDFGGRHP
jgi:uncharacterized protein (DUF2062 family)